MSADRRDVYRVLRVRGLDYAVDAAPGRDCVVWHEGTAQHLVLVRDPGDAVLRDIVAQWDGTWSGAWTGEPLPYF